MTSIVDPCSLTSPRALSPRPAKEASWHIVQLKPGGATLAERNLGRQGFGVFFPRRDVTRQSGGRLVSRSEALFPGYGFVAIGSNAPWRAINSTYGVARLLMTPDRTPAKVPNDFMKILQSRCNQGVLTTPPEIAPGHQVRISVGPFADMMARIERLEPLGRVTVLLELMSQTVRLSLSSAEVSRNGIVAS